MTVTKSILHQVQISIIHQNRKNIKHQQNLVHSHYF